VLAAACTSPVKNVEVEPACVQEETQTDPGDGTGGAAVAWLGSIRLTETRDAEQGTSVRASVGAAFYDVSNFSVENPVPLTLSATCVGLTGQPSQTGSRTALPITRVDITGMVGGPRTLSNPDGGSLSFAPGGAIFGTSPVGASVVGVDGGFGDITFEAAAPPAAMVVTSPDLSGGHSVGDEDLIIKWEPGGTGLVSLEVSNNAATGAERATLSCIVKDDGCHTIPSGLITWLKAGRADPAFTVALKRNISRGALVASTDGGAGAIFSMTSEARGKVTP
jgi:hypothetical protein